MSYILTIGISPSWFRENDKTYNMSESRSPSEIEGSIATFEADLRTLKETTIEIVQVRPGVSEDWEKMVAAVLKRQWDAISIGGGLRRHPDLSDYFTRLMHMAISTNSQATFLFPLIPDDVFPAIKKYLPSASMRATRRAGGASQTICGCSKPAFPLAAA